VRYAAHAMCGHAAISKSRITKLIGEVAKQAGQYQKSLKEDENWIFQSKAYLNDLHFEV